MPETLLDVKTAFTQLICMHGEIGTPRKEWKEVRSSLISEPQMLESIVSLTLLSAADPVVGAHAPDIRDFD